MGKIKPDSKSRFGRVQERMISAVVNFCLGDNAATTMSVPAFYNLIINELQPNMVLLGQLRTLIALPIWGCTAQKEALKGTLSEMSVTIMKAVYTYAQDTDNETLEGQMKISRSELLDMNYIGFVAYLQNAINIVSPLTGSLGDYNVTDATVGVWQGLVRQLNGMLTETKELISFRKSINEQIQTVLRSCMLTLYMQCDQIAFQFRSSNMLYYNNYLANRKLNPHHLSTQGRITVTTAAGKPAAGEVFIVGTDKSGVLDLEGYVLMNYLPFGIHEVAITTAAGTYTYGPFRFKKGKSLTLDFTLPANGDGKKIVALKEEDVESVVSN